MFDLVEQPLYHTVVGAHDGEAQLGALPEIVGADLSDAYAERVLSAVLDSPKDLALLLQGAALEDPDSLKSNSHIKSSFSQ